MTTNNACPVIVEPQDKTQYEADQAQAVKDASAKAKADTAKATARQAVLDKLGLTADEVAALLG